MDSKLLSGNWSLLYNGAATVEEDKDWRQRSGEVEGPFLSFFKPMTEGIVRTRGNYQVFDVRGGRVENLAVRRHRALFCPSAPHLLRLVILPISTCSHPTLQLAAQLSPRCCALIVSQAFRFLDRWDGFLNIRGTCEPVPPEEVRSRSSLANLRVLDRGLPLSSITSTARLRPAGERCACLWSSPISCSRWARGRQRYLSAPSSRRAGCKPRTW